MANKIRKQLYLDRTQEKLLKRLAKVRRVSEAAIIRDAIMAHTQAGPALPPIPEAWERECAFIHHWMAQGTVSGRRRWRRDELYDR